VGNRVLNFIIFCLYGTKNFLGWQGRKLSPSSAWNVLGVLKQRMPLEWQMREYAVQKAPTATMFEENSEVTDSFLEMSANWLEQAGYTVEALLLRSEKVVEVARQLLGIYPVLTIAHPKYPSQWRRLGKHAPPVLWLSDYELLESPPWCGVNLSGEQCTRQLNELSRESLTGEASAVLRGEFAGVLSGVGCRLPLPEVLELCYQVGQWAGKRRLLGVSGGAKGCDTAFGEGVMSVGGDIVHILPHGFSLRNVVGDDRGDCGEGFVGERLIGCLDGCQNGCLDKCICECKSRCNGRCRKLRDSLETRTGFAYRTMLLENPDLVMQERLTLSESLNLGNENVKTFQTEQTTLEGIGERTESNRGSVLKPQLRGRRFYISVCSPNEPFSTARAMERNQLIYAFGDLTIVHSARFKTGGSWHGAIKALRQHLPVAVLCGSGKSAECGKSLASKEGALGESESIELDRVSQSLVMLGARAIRYSRDAFHSQLADKCERQNNAQLQEGDDCYSNELEEQLNLAFAWAEQKRAGDLLSGLFETVV
jgi:predicted Rossmann fold nucleotide-binding protein DprA/Smf involved in DNA uptake